MLLLNIVERETDNLWISMVKNSITSSKIMFWNKLCVRKQFYKTWCFNENPIKVLK